MLYNKLPPNSVAYNYTLSLMGPQVICSLAELGWPQLSSSDSRCWSAGLAPRLTVRVKSALWVSFFSLDWSCLKHALLMANGRNPRVSTKAGTVSWGLGLEQARSPPAIFHWPKQVTWLSRISVGQGNTTLVGGFEKSHDQRHEYVI